jgi:hydrogenase-4 component B
LALRMPWPRGDLKRLLAYSSIENMGIIFLALGLGLIFQSLGHPILSGIAFASGFLHILNHSLFKGLLFLASGAVLSTVHTRSLDNLGGLIHRMPQTAFFFLVGSLAICAFPPFNGFISEWMIYQSLLSIGQLPEGSLQLILPFAAVLLGLVGVLAAATFVKAFSAGFLAMPRSHHAEHAREVSVSMRLGMGILALLCLLFGIFPTLLFPLLNPVIFHLTGYPQIEDALSVSHGLLLQANPANPVSLSPALVFILLLGLAPLVIALPRWLGGKTAIRKVDTWSCGVTAQPDFEYTGTAFSQPLALVYHKLQATVDFYDRYFYIPLAEGLIRFSHRFKSIQAGSLQLYLVYIFCTLILCLVWVQL